MSALDRGTILGLEHLEGVNDALSGLTGLNDTIDVASLSGLEGVGEGTLVIGCLLLNILATEDDLNSALGSHDGNLSRGPSVVEVTSEVLRAHDIVSATICLPGNEANLGHASLSVRIEDLGAMLDNTTELLVGSWEEAWHIGEGDEGDLEGITEADEASSLDRGVDIEATSQDLRLVGHDADGATLDLSEASDHVLGVCGHDLVEVVAIADTLDDVEHIVRLVGVVGHDVVQQLR